jgi:hypothetical protein
MSPDKRTDITVAAAKTNCLLQLPLAQSAGMVARFSRAKRFQRFKGSHISQLSKSPNRPILFGKRSCWRIHYEQKWLNGVARRNRLRGRHNLSHVMPYEQTRSGYGESDAAQRHRQKLLPPVSK